MAAGLSAKPVRVIVPFPPGGANDIVARLLLPKISEQMGQSFIIENRSGAGGTDGSAVVAQSKPDGYTLLIQTVPPTFPMRTCTRSCRTTRCAISRG
jgi:tripartite-type tricarboxylate transporter receptor subunit TctC